MASSEFHEAVAYALSCVGLEDLRLHEAKARGGSHTPLYDGYGVFAWFPTGYGTSLCYQLAAAYCLLCSTTA